MDKKEIYQEKLKKDLDSLKLKIDQLKNELEKDYLEQKVEVVKLLDDLEEKKNNLQKEYDDLKSASGDAWKEIKMGIERSWVDLEAAFKLAKSKFKQK